MRHAALVLSAALLSSLVPSSARADDDDGPKQPRVAFALSAGATVAGGATIWLSPSAEAQLAGIGLLAVGPWVGHWYCGHYLTRGMFTRTAGAFVGLLGAGLAISDCPIFGDTCETKPFVVGMMIAGGALYVAGAVDDIATAPGAARRYNREHHAITDLSVAPVVTPHQAGLSVSGRF